MRHCKILALLGAMWLPAAVGAAPVPEGTAAPAPARPAAAEQTPAPPKPGAEAGPAVGVHRFKLTFEPTAIDGMAPVRENFKDKGEFQSIFDDLADEIALPRDVPVTFKDCGEDNAYWNPAEASLTMCWELIALYNRGYEAEEGEEQAFLFGADQDTVLMGTTTFIVLHELGHGLIDLFKIPTTGREEDSVDQFATLMLIAADEPGQPVEKRTSRLALLGAYFFKSLATEPGELEREILADEHSLGQQRYFDVMCLVLGSDPAAYSPILTPGIALVSDAAEEDPDAFDDDKLTDWMEKTDALNILPFARASGCEEEYQKYQSSWAYLVQTFMNPV